MIRRRTLGRSGFDVSAIGLGCMGMSEFYGASDDEQSLATLAHACDLGVTFFDTADTYGFGHNERLLGRFLAKRRNDVVVATKCGIVREPGRYERTLDSSPAYIKAACEASLARLGTDRIDLFYLHRLSPAVAVEEAAGAFSELIGKGMIGAYGLCEVSEATLRRAHAVHPVTALQSEYSLWSRDPENGVLAACRDIGAAFVAYSPLGRGFLTGKIASTDELAKGDFRRSNPRFQKDNFERNRVLLDAVTTIAQRYGCTQGQVALAWLLSRDDNVIPIPGTRHKRYLDENAGAAAMTLSPDEMATLDSIFSPEAVKGERYTEEGMKGLNA